jgi:4-hydroxy-3-methylbut-2-enyl diphosphate reductase
MRRRFPRSEIRFLDTVCQPTKQRQAAAMEMARQADVVIVIGGAHSNNTRELADTCRRFCPRVHQVADAGGLRAEWLMDVETAGLTAGTSTPDEVVEEVEQRLRELAGMPGL